MRILRSPDEIRFRLRQEATNLRLFARPPHLPDGFKPQRSILPPPPDLAGCLGASAFAQECERIGEEILQHRFPLMGITVDTGQEIRWRRDYSSGRETAAIYFRRVPYLDAARAGDHKIIWELNRHQHLVLLAQASIFTGRSDFLDEIRRQLESWLEQNPLHRGINWSSALEVGFRALSWIWIDHLAGDRLSLGLRRRLLESLYHHGLHLAANLSFYFSPNTHLLGEAVALHALGRLFAIEEWQQTGARVVRQELDRQVRADGSHFEQSAYYHVYALDMFVFHAVLSGADEDYQATLRRMADYLDCLLGVPGALPMLGDDDGGRLFHPYGPRDRFGLATLATCGVLLDRPEWIRDPQSLEEQAAWWMGPDVLDCPPGLTAPRSRRFPDSGLISMAHQDAQIIVDAGSFGAGSGGHSHADTLSLVVRLGSEQLLIDPGTYTYVGDPEWRNRFRGTAAHNTVRIHGADQAIPAGPFSWDSKPAAKVLSWGSGAQRDFLEAECSYAGFRHQRTVLFSKDRMLLVVLDRIEGSGVHSLEQFWHFGAPARQCSQSCFQVGDTALLAVDPAGEASLTDGWMAPVFGLKIPAPVACVTQQVALPATFTSVLDLSGRFRTLRFQLHPDGSGIDCIGDDSQEQSLIWTSHGIL